MPQSWDESWVLARNQKGRITPREQGRRKEFTGTKEEGSITAKIFLLWKGQATKWWEQQCHLWSNLNYNSVVSNINISVPSLSTAQTPQRPRNFATSTTSTFKTATRTATIFCACHYWESTVSWILKFADNSSLVHFILEIWIYLKINVECDEDLVKRKGGINFGNIVPFEKRQHHFQSSENNFFIGGRWKINNSKHFLQEYIKVNEKNTPLSKRAKTGNIQTKSVLWVGEGDVEETNCSPTDRQFHNNMKKMCKCVNHHDLNDLIKMKLMTTPCQSVATLCSLMFFYFFFKTLFFSFRNLYT